MGTCVVCKGWDLGRLQQGAFDTGDTRLRVLSSHTWPAFCLFSWVLQGSLQILFFHDENVCRQRPTPPLLEAPQQLEAVREGEAYRWNPLDNCFVQGLGPWISLNRNMWFSYVIFLSWWYGILYVSQMALKRVFFCRWSSFSQGVDGDGRWMIIVIVSETIAPLITKYILLYM